MQTHPAAALFPLLEGAALDALAADIQAHGLRVPIVVHPDGRVLDGRNRLRACDAVGVTPARETWTGELGSEVDYVISLNLARRHLDESQRAMVAARLATLPDGGAIYAKSGAPIGAPSQPEAAARLNVSRRSVQRARLVLDSGTPALIAAVDQGTLAVSEAATIAKLPAEAQAAVLAQGQAGVKVRQATRAASRSWTPQDWPAGEYGVILADPPWQPSAGLLDPTRQIENQYPTMSQDALEALAPRVQACAADDCVLLLWTTTQKLAEAVAIIAAWGFEIKSGAVWVKPSIGMGYWFRARHELLLLATQGHPPTPLEPDRPDSVIIAPRGAHSQKPTAQYDLIAAMFPGVPKMELFARGPARPGWDTWGNE
jgi:N6-adenosine-specific RNA methylase IME4